MRRIIILISFTLVLIFGCKDPKPVKFINVFKDYVPNSLPDSVRKSGSKFDTYYVYNYNDSNLKQLIKMLDTLSIDTNYQFHSYRFLKYNSSLPDTAKLNKKMLLGSDYELDEDPGSAKFYKYQILDFTYTHHYFSEGKNFPDSYSIDFNTKNTGKLNTKYFIKDSLTKKLREIPVESLYPHINDPH